MATILTIIPYAFYPPMGGGALRCFYLLREMSYHHSVYLLTGQDKEDFKRSSSHHFPSNVHIVSSYKSALYSSVFNFLPSKVANAINFRILKRSFRGSTDTSFLQVYPVLNTLLKAVKFDLAFYENLEALSSYRDMIKSRIPSSTNVYDAHNVDSELWIQKASLENNLLCKKYAKKALLTEKRLFKKADLFFSCSESDNEKLAKINKHRITGTVLPNGVDTTSNAYDANPDKFRNHNIIFCGSLDYFPNKEGLKWFYLQVLPLLKEKLPSVLLTVIGSVTNKDDYQFLQHDEAVNFVGKVETVSPYYKKSSVSIVPLKSGSGTRLKILEAMSFGNPVVSTSIGAEGIEYTPEKNILIADEPKSFACNVLRLLSDHLLFQAVRENALKLVQAHYDWGKIGARLTERLNDVLQKGNAS